MPMQGFADYLRLNRIFDRINQMEKDKGLELHLYGYKLHKNKVVFCSFLVCNGCDHEHKTSWSRAGPSSAQAWIKMLTAMMKALRFESGRQP